MYGRSSLDYLMFTAFEKYSQKVFANHISLDTILSLSIKVIFSLVQTLSLNTGPTDFQNNLLSVMTAGLRFFEVTRFIFSY